MIHALFTIISDFLIILVDDVHICVQVIIPLHANTVFCIYNEDIMKGAQLFKVSVQSSSQMVESINLVLTITESSDSGW